MSALGIHRLCKQSGPSFEIRDSYRIFVMSACGKRVLIGHSLSSRANPRVYKMCEDCQVHLYGGVIC